jgi:hypothetical protein
MRAWFNTLLHLLIFLAVFPCTTIFAGEDRTHLATVRLSVYYVPRCDLDAGKIRRQFKHNRSQVYQLETKLEDGEKNRFRELWAI